MLKKYALPLLAPDGVGTAPPPAAPAAAPAAPAPTPAPAAAPAAAPPAPSGDNPFAAIDKKFADYDKPKPATGDKPPAGAKPPGDKPAAGAKPPGDKPDPGAKNVPKELRAEYDKLKTEHEQRTKAYQELETKLAAAEKRGADTTAITEKMTALEKKLEEAHAELATYRYEATPDFKEKYDKPFDRALAYTAEVVQKLTVIDQKTGQPRPAKFEDFKALYNMDYQEAVDTAHEIFGRAGNVVVNHLTELKRLEFERGNALKEAKQTMAERAKTQEAEQLRRRTEIDSSWKKLNEELSNHQDYRVPADDQELAQLRDEGYRIFDAPTANPEQRLVKNAHIRQRVAQFGPNQVTIRRLRAEVEKLKAENEGLKNPTPQPGRRPGGDPAPSGGSNESWDDAARKELS